MSFIKTALNYSPVPASGVLAMICLFALGISISDIIGMAMMATSAGAVTVLFFIGVSRMYRPYDEFPLPLHIKTLSLVRLFWVPFYAAVMTAAFTIRAGYTLDDALSWSLLLVAVSIAFCFGLLARILLDLPFTLFDIATGQTISLPDQLPDAATFPDQPGADFSIRITASETPRQCPPYSREDPADLL